MSTNDSAPVQRFNLSSWTLQHQALVIFILEIGRAHV